MFIIIWLFKWRNGLTFIGLRDFHSPFAQYVELVTQCALFYDVVPFRIKFLQKRFQVYEKITVDVN